MANRDGSIHTAAVTKENLMDKYECPCGYVYDPEEGDADAMIPAGTAFEDLPDDWVCPKCGAEKEFFEKMD
jgi:rubredoxin